MSSILEKGIPCFHCQKIIDFRPQEKISRREECPHCSSPLHCCKMCQFYDASAYNECREPQAERILEKEKSNFCEYFKLSNGHSHNADKEHLLSMANALFKKDI